MAQTIQFSIPRWNIEALTGYKPKTAFWQDFSIAEKFGIRAIRGTYVRAKREWSRDCEYWTELVMVLNHKIWYWHEMANDANAKGMKKEAEWYAALTMVYDTFWQDAERAVDKWSKEEQEYYFRVTD